MGIATFGDSILSVLLAPFVSQVLGGDAALYRPGADRCAGLGGLIGGLMIGDISRRL